MFQTARGARPMAPRSLGSKRPPSVLRGSACPHLRVTPVPPPEGPRNVQWFQCGLVSKARTLLHHSTLDLGVTKGKKKKEPERYLARLLRMIFLAISKGLFVALSEGPPYAPTVLPTVGSMDLPCREKCLSPPTRPRCMRVVLFGVDGLGMRFWGSFRGRG